MHARSLSLSVPPTQMHKTLSNCSQLRGQERGWTWNIF
jgi:hypothetical protein